MSLLKQIDDKGAVLSWSPLHAYGNFVALGTKVGHFPKTLPVNDAFKYGIVYRILLALGLMIMVENLNSMH
jgi:cadmium resistance protein CadD (predicted permease)